MPFSLRRRHLLLSGAALSATNLGSGMGSPAFAQRGDDGPLEITTNETATIDGRQWHTTFVGGGTVDAVHRSVLLRFPTAADQIGDFLRAGRVLLSAELALTYGDYEIVPDGYLCRDGLGRGPWTNNPPNWHIEAFPLRQAWKADRARGPTFNASVNGARYWGRYGASDGQRDRLFDALEPQELSAASREARFDVTKLLATPLLATDAGDRLRWLADSGFLLRKLETYDSRYREPGNAYDWNMSTGGHGLRFATARLIVSGRRTTGLVTIAMPATIEVELQLTKPDGSRPTAALLPLAQLVERGRRAAMVQGTREEWELKRIAELRKAGGDDVSAWSDFEGEKGYKEYQRHVAEVLSTPPRYWRGWGIEDDLLLWYLFRDILPAPVQDHLKAYWKAWLQPDVATDAMIHPQSPDAIDYWKRNHDWRGRASFFRNGYNYAVSTQNFNHTAAMGALLAGAMIDAPNAMADGRHGLEALLLRFWGFLDGTTQETLDHYYLSITLSGQKMFADFAPTPVDRLMGRILVDRTMEMLVTLYHSRLRRFVSSSGRARIGGLLAEQDGVYGALHSVSKEGAVKYVDRTAIRDSQVHGLPIWGYDFPPGRVAMQSIVQPFAPSWIAGLIDDKPVPFEETAMETTRAAFKPPLWRRSWLGRWHGLASADIRGGTFDFMAQWVRAPAKSSTMEDLGTLTVRYAANKPDLVTTADGIAVHAGLPLTFQSRNRAIVFTKPHSSRDRLLAALGDKGVSQLATVIGLWNFADKKDWEIYVDGKKIDSFPTRLTAKQRILIKDGVTYLAIQPLPLADLGRDAEIEIGPGGGGKADPIGAEIAPALLISMYNLRRDKPLPISGLDLGAITHKTYGGFVLEMGDAEQHGSFEAFTKHIAATELTATWHDDRHQMEVAYRSGKDLMEAAFGTDFEQPNEHFIINPGHQEKAIPYRRLNGQWPYLTAGLERDTSWAQQGTVGRLEKNGAVLVTEAGRKAYLLADPLSGAVVGYNPLPDPQPFALTTRDGMTLKADGKVGLLRAEYRPASHEVEISHALKPDQKADDFAKVFLIGGLKEAPRVTVNGRVVLAMPTDNGFQVVAF
jgi:hypothetical protein